MSLGQSWFRKDTDAVQVKDAQAVRPSAKAGAIARNNLLDLSRFLAALVVLLYHLAYRGHTVGHIENAPFDALAGWTKYGFLGVPFFFMISGYVILMSANRQPQWQGFIASRAARLYPAYWCAIFATVAVMVLAAGNPTDISVYQTIVNLSMFQTFVGVDHIDGVFWSLTVEIVFYAWIVALIVFKAMHRFESFSLVILLVAAIHALHPLPSVLYVLLLPYWSCYFVAGAMFHLIQSQGMNTSRLTTLALCFALALNQCLHYTQKMEDTYLQAFSGAAALMITTGMFAFFALIVATKRQVSIPGAVTLGALSYPIYLLHENIGYITLGAFANTDNQYVVLGAFTLAIMVVSWVISRYVEKSLGRRVKVLFFKGLMLFQRPSKSTTDWKPSASDRMLESSLRKGTKGAQGDQPSSVEEKALP